MNRWLLVILLACALPAQAAVQTAATCSNTNVASAISAAADGDTVHIPAGNCTWAGAVSTGDKRLIIQGTGSGGSGTNLTLSGTNRLNLNGSKTLTLRNIRFLGQADFNGLIRITGSMTDLRITGNQYFRADRSLYFVSLGHRHRGGQLRQCLCPRLNSRHRQYHRDREQHIHATELLRFHARGLGTDRRFLRRAV
jgi:hypothetical protein